MRQCIRGLKEFKKGCPQRLWTPQDNSGCPAWKIYEFENGGKMENCIDILMEYWTFELVKLAEGTQVTTQSLKNRICDINQEQRQRYIDFTSKKDKIKR